jgi:hypothetical protein
MPTLISNLWVPDIWVKGVAEQARVLPGLINSGIAVRSSDFDAFATGAAQTINLPYFRDITDQTDEVQVENTAPGTDNNITTGKQIATILNRVSKNSATALSAQVSGEKPVDEILKQIALRRLKQRQTTLFNILRGIFHFASAPAAGTGALKDNRSDYHTETGLSATAANLIDSTKVITSIAKLGDLRDSVHGGVIVMHPNVEAALLASDATSFKELSISPGLALRTYKGLQVFTSQLLVRAGSVNGFVYDTYISARGTIAYGEKAQAGDEIDVSSLQFKADKDLNNEVIFDRTRFMMHPNGLRWVGTPAGQSATNAELLVNTNWTLDYATADRVGIVCIRTNG